MATAPAALLPSGRPLLPRPAETPMRLNVFAALTALLLAPTATLAVDGVTAASRKTQYAGTQDAVLWIVGEGFSQGVQATLSGDGITVEAADRVPEAQRIDGGQGDGIALYFSIAASATPGLRDVVVTDPDGSSAIGQGLVEILAAVEGGPPAPEIPPSTVDRVTRASPNYAEQGDQVNLWIVGGAFEAGARVTFDNPGLGPAMVDGRSLPVEVLRNAESENGQADGIQYFMRVTPDAATGFVAITVTNPDGSTATGRDLFEIVPPGSVPVPREGDADVDSITGASPPGAFSGRDVALWIWGEGFTTGATVEFDHPGIQPFAPPEVVEDSRSHPGYSGIRNFLNVAADATPGPVTVTVVNPNGTRAEARGLLTIVDGRGQGGAVTDLGNCPDPYTSIAGIDRVVPDEVVRGAPVTVAVQGQAFACGAGMLIPGGGLRPLSPPRLVRDSANPFYTTLFWELEVASDAALGDRAVTVVNPNNSSKTLPVGFTIVDPPKAKDDDFNCRAAPGEAPAGWLWILLVPLAALRRR